MKEKFYFFPKTKLGKLSFWLTLLGIALIFIPYWIALAFRISISFLVSIPAISLLIIFGLTSLVSILKNKDRAILLFLTSLLGLFGLLLILGEFIFPNK